MRTHFTIQDCKNLRITTTRMKDILNANYKKANLTKIVQELKYSSNENKSLILNLLMKHEEVNCALGNYTGSEYKIELLEGAKLYHTKPFPIPEYKNKL